MRFVYSYKRPRLLGYIYLLFSVFSLQAQDSDSSWIGRYTEYISHDHLGDIDTLTTYAWKAFYLAQSHHNDSLQVLALGRLVNAQSIDSLQRYVSILDTFPDTPHTAYQHSQMQLSYYRARLGEMTEQEVHRFVEELLEKADSVYADSVASYSLDSSGHKQAHIHYLFANRLYLSLLMESVDLESSTSPFYSYLTRFNTIIDQIPDTYIKAKLNSYMTSSSVHLKMHDYANVIRYSEKVIQGVLHLDRSSGDFQDLPMNYASICYMMCYQQLACYNLITPDRLARNWAFLKSPYGRRCRDYLMSYGEGELTPALFYHMAKGRYRSVIEKTEYWIQKYADTPSAQMVYLHVQNEAISRLDHPVAYIDKMYRNYTLKKSYNEHRQREREIDFTSLFTSNELKRSILNDELKKKNDTLLSSLLLFVGVFFVFLLGIWSITIMRVSNKRKQKFIQKMSDLSHKTLEEQEKTELAKSIQTTCIDNMNHEIRTPLNTIVGFSELLLEDDALDLESKRMYSNQIDTSSSMLLQIINDVLDTAQIESGQYSLNTSHFEVHSLCTHAMESMRHRVQSGVEMRLDYRLDAQSTMHTDKTRLLQILFNFLSNACKHTHRGEIILSCSWADVSHSKICFRVTDTGHGIPAEKQTHLFERFAKLNHSAQGTGLGLNIAASLAHVMKAEIGYDKDYTDGARFYLIIPTHG